MERKSKVVSFCGLMAAFSSIFQLALVFFPGIGVVFKPFSLLPIAIAALVYPEGAVLSVICAGLIDGMVYSQEGFIFLCTSGTLGIALGWGVRKRKGRGWTTLLGSIVIFFGICVLTMLIGFPAFGERIGDWGISSRLVLFFAFSLCYSFLWTLLIEKLYNWLRKNSQWFYTQ